jgi:hypothetical protein
MLIDFLQKHSALEVAMLNELRYQRQLQEMENRFETTSKKLTELIITLNTISLNQNGQAK